MNEKAVEEIIIKMLSDEANIQSVERSDDPASPDSVEEYYFTYPGTKYLWSVLQGSEGTNIIFYYPDKGDRSNFLRFEGIHMSPEGRKNLRLLFTGVRSKLFGFDDVVKEILG